MVHGQEVIDAEVIEPEERPRSRHDDESPADIVRDASKRLAGSFHRLGLNTAASKAQTVADVTEAAQRTYQAARPGLSAVGRFFAMLEEKGVTFENNRPPFRRRP